MTTSSSSLSSFETTFSGEVDESFLRLLAGLKVFAGEAEDAGFAFCLANIASIPSFRCWIGSMKVADSFPTFPTSVGTW